MHKRIVKPDAFAIIEILIAITIISIVLMTIISGISAGIVAISGNRNLTIAMIVARSKLNEFQMMRMRGPDIYDEPVKEYPGRRHFFASGKPSLGTRGSGSVPPWSLPEGGLPWPPPYPSSRPGRRGYVSGTFGQSSCFPGGRIPRSRKRRARPQSVAVGS